MIKILYNGQNYFIYDHQVTILNLINYFNINSNILILEYNGVLLNKIFWNNTFLQNYDRIEVITIVGGG